MNTFEMALSDLLGVEGGYSNNIHDRGGKTRYGITEEVARRHGYAGEMKDLPYCTAKEIYKKDYWEAPGFSLIEPLSNAIAFELFESGVNVGPGLAAKWLQRVLNVANRRGKTFPDLKVDGKIGPVTVAALRSFINYRKEGEAVVYAALNCLQGAHYTTITEARDANEEFWYGWMLRRVNGSW